MQFNTLYQLLAMKLTGSPLLDIAESLLMVPDLFHWLLTGVKCNEMTEASTSQFYNPVEGRLGHGTAGPVFAAHADFGPDHPAGHDAGAAAGESGRRERAGVGPVVLPGSHDTASAVMAVPAHSHPGARPDWCYVSLGTWALMGIESPQPVVNDAVLKLNFTNEGGVGGTTRLLKNITGLWLVQECRRVWNQAGANLDWEALNGLSAAAAPLSVVHQPRRLGFSRPRRHARGHPRPSAARPASRCRKTTGRWCAAPWRAWP